MLSNLIHTVWLGDKQPPEIYETCQKSWKLHLPNYKHVEWHLEDLGTELKVIGDFLCSTNPTEN